MCCCCCCCCTAAAIVEVGQIQRERGAGEEEKERGRARKRERDGANDFFENREAVDWFLPGSSLSVSPLISHPGVLPLLYFWSTLGENARGAAGHGALRLASLETFRGSQKRKGRRCRVPVSQFVSLSLLFPHCLSLCLSSPRALCQPSTRGFSPSHGAYKVAAPCRRARL